MTDRKIAIITIALLSFFVALILASGSREYPLEARVQPSDALCENYYFTNPDAMEEIGCDIEATGERIQRVKQGKY